MLLYPDEEVYTMRRKEYPTIEENVRSLIRMYGAQTFLKHLTPEEIIQNLNIEQREQLIQQLTQQNDGKNGKKETAKKK